MIFALRYGWWLLGVLGLAIVLQIMAQFGILSPFQDMALAITRPVQSGLTSIFKPIDDFLDYDESGLREENQNLREELASTQAQLTQALIDRERLRELEQAADLFTDDEQTYVAADRVQIVGESAGESIIVINKGSADDIEEGMVVLSPSRTLLGKVTSVTENYAYVRLLDDSRMRVNVRIPETEVTGTLKSDLRGGLFIDFVQGDARAGNAVVTSGLGGTFPPDIRIGRVSSVSGTQQDINLTVHVDPAVRLSTVNTVWVLTSFMPSIIPPEDS